MLARLFLLADAVPADELERALGDGAALLETTGLVRVAEGGLEPTVRIAPHDHLLVASDGPLAGGRETVPDVSLSSANLAWLTVRRPVARALDVGTGSGIQALLLSPVAERVVATDVSERSLAFAAFNAALNGVDNVELRHGAWLEPVEGETFGLAVCNAPFAVSPENTLLLRDAGLPRDEVSAMLARALPGVLADGGHATLTASWVVEGDDPAERPRSWLADTGCDAWILHDEPGDAYGQAGAWNSYLAGDRAAYTAAIDRWLAYGLLVMRRGGGRVRAAALPDGRTGQASDHLMRMLDALPLADLPDARVLGVRVTAVPGVRVEQAAVLADDGWEAAEVEITFAGGIPFSLRVDPVAARLVLALDGSRPLARVLDEIVPAEGRKVALALVRRLLELGLATAS